MSTELLSYSPPEDTKEQILDYPSKQPEFDYLTNGEELFELPDDAEKFRQEADELLKKHGVPGMSERIPVLSYGANANPVRYQKKMAKYASEATSDLLQVTPFQCVSLQGTKVVWHGKQGQSGNIFAELYNGPLVEDDATQSQAYVAWMTKEQLAVMHTSEGATYQLTENIPVLAGADRKQLMVYAYTAGNSSVLLKDGKPIEVKRPGAETDRGMTARRALEYMIASLAARDGMVVDASTPEELIDEMKSKPNLDAKEAAQLAVQTALQEAGASADFSFSTDVDNRIGRADLGIFDDDHNLLHLMEEHIASVRPDLDALATGEIRPGEDLEETIRRTAKGLGKKDLANEVRRRAHAEIKERSDRDRKQF